VESVLLQIDISHEDASSVYAKLISPEGTEIDLFGEQNPPLCQQADIQARFYDNAPNSSIDYDSQCNIQPPAKSGDFQPIDPFSRLKGEKMDGDWILWIGKEVPPFRRGFLNGWTLSLSDGVVVQDECSDVTSVEFRDDTIPDIVPVIFSLRGLSRQKTRVVTGIVAHRKLRFSHLCPNCHVHLTQL